MSIEKHPVSRAFLQEKKFKEDDEQQEEAPQMKLKFAPDLVIQAPVFKGTIGMMVNGYEWIGVTIPIIKKALFNR